MNIRKMTITDYDKVYALWLSCKGMGLNDVDDSREGISRFLDRNPATCFVCENDISEIIGVIMAGSDGRRGYIYHTAVREDCRRQGVAAKLVDSVMVAFSDLGISKTALVVFERNKAGNDFWESMGFEKRTDIVYRNRALTNITRYDT
ncbi:MAG: GNAT family N-acetyltransferase [Oscillospiraceae bacterium]|nr:GNAT family N-acetyltransferase [Oscillospiraceae bacterium]